LVDNKTTEVIGRQSFAPAGAAIDYLGRCRHLELGSVIASSWEGDVAGHRPLRHVGCEQDADSLACGRRQLLYKATQIARGSRQGVHLGQIFLGSAHINSWYVTNSRSLARAHSLSQPHTLAPSAAWRDERSVPLPGFD
jgi:hypothetical protein